MRGAVEMKRVFKETIKAKGKSVKTIINDLKKRGYCTFDWDEFGTVLEAHDCFKGQVIRIAEVEFSVRDRAVTDISVWDV